MQLTNVSAAPSVQYMSIAFNMFADFLDPHSDSLHKASRHSWLRITILAVTPDEFQTLKWP